jgi:hypothetical protein
MVKLEFYDPSGTLDAATPHAPRLESLAGKRIGMVSNGQVAGISHAAYAQEFARGRFSPCASLV